MRGGGEAGHVRARLGDDPFSDAGAHCGNGNEPISLPVKWCDHRLDPSGEFGDDGVHISHRSGSGALAPETLGDQRTARSTPQSAPGFASRIRFWTRPASAPGSRWPLMSASSIARPEAPVIPVATGRQLDASVFQQVLQPLSLLGTWPREQPAGPGQIAQRTDRLRGANEPRTKPCAPNRPATPHRAHPPCARADSSPVWG